MYLQRTFLSQTQTNIALKRNYFGVNEVSYDGYIAMLEDGKELSKGEIKCLIKCCFKIIISKEPELKGLAHS